jgi:hypothetical protein
LKAIFDSYNPDERIPVHDYLRNRKLMKYFNRETMAALVGVGRLFNGEEISPETPFYYATGLLEYEDYGLNEIVMGSLDENSKFSQRLFIENGLTRISPLNQFKVLQNMPLSFISINYGLRGDNAVIYSSASGLLLYALHSTHNNMMLLGAGKVYRDGKVEAGFALVGKNDIENSPFLSSNAESIELFRSWADTRNR